MTRILVLSFAFLSACTSAPTNAVEQSAPALRQPGNVASSDGVDAKCSAQPKKSVNPSTDQFVIVGAGVAGLGAARSLIENSVPANHITVIETEAQAGGKVSSIQYGGRPYEMGAAIIIPGAYAEIEKLRDEFGLTTRPLGRGIFLDVANRKRGQALDPNNKDDHGMGDVLDITDKAAVAAFSEELGRYLKSYSQWHEPPGGQYHLLAADGFKNIHPELKKSWYQFVADNKYENLNAVLMSLIGGSGYAYRQADPTEASVIVRVFDPTMMKSLFIDRNPILSFNGGGYQELWLRLAADLANKGVQFRYQTTVTKIERNAGGKVHLTLRRKSPKPASAVQDADQVIFAADLTALPKVVTDLNECEKTPISNIVRSDYRSYLVKLDKFPALEQRSGGIVIRPYIKGELKNGQMDDSFGQPVLLVKPYADTNNVLAYIHGKRGISQGQASRNIREMFAKFAVHAKVVEARQWNYFPRFKSTGTAGNDVESNYRTLMAMQGSGGLWFAGEIFSFGTTHASYRNGSEFARLLVQGNLGL